MESLGKQWSSKGQTKFNNNTMERSVVIKKVSPSNLSSNIS